MKLNLGCGKDIREGYLNIDMYASDGVDIICDVSNLPLKDNSADEIIASDILEHFSWRKVRNVIREWRRVLTHYGRIWIRTPRLEGIIELYQRRPKGWRREDGKGIDPIVERIFGAQDYGGNFHYVIFDTHSLVRLLIEEGFFVIDVMPDGEDISNLCVTAVKRLKDDEKYIEGCCPKTDDCHIYKEFMDRLKKIDIIGEPPIRICADDLRFYSYQDLNDEIRINSCLKLREIKKMVQNLRVTWQSPAFSPSGYAFATRGYMLGLDDLGVRISCKPIWGDCKMTFEDEEEGDVRGL